MTEIYKIDFASAKTEFQFYHLFAEVFDFPDYYGHNPDALWDCFRGYFYPNTTITLKNIQALPSLLDMHKDIILRIFRDVKVQYDVTVLVEREDGSTVDIAAFLEGYKT